MFMRPTLFAALFTVASTALAAVPGEVIAAALEEEPANGLPQLVRCGLIDATIGSIVANIPVELIAALARVGLPITPSG